MTNQGTCRGLPALPVSRRSFLGATVTAGVAGLGLPALLAAQGKSGERRADTAVIQVWLGGGPSQFETFDPKPDAAADVRGPFQTIATPIPGVRFCEVLPGHARVLKKVAILRSVYHNNSDHEQAMHICTTGKPKNGQPSTGSYAARIRASRRPGLPPYVHLGYNDQTPTFNPAYVANFSAAYLGGAYNPFTVIDNPALRAFRVSNLDLAQGVTVAQLADRKALLARFDQVSRAWNAGGSVQALDHIHRAAFDMVTRPQVRAAFDISREPDGLRRRYGMHRWGQSCLLARRLVEAGVSFVTVNLDPLSFTWDMHASSNDLGIARGMKKFGAMIDSAIPALVEDLHQRGLNRKVLVIAWGEFGRTPKMNPNGGRDHWGHVMSVLLAGGGLRVGQVIGASDREGGVPKDRPITPGDVLATMYKHLRIDPDTMFPDASGRPIPILYEGEVLPELV